ncbi:helix-turn-helix domain-containing protein [Sporosarcina sp. FSL K6-5500]|uniref:helix-turn-helix domain-containing protein n=1 Tax=Sporosarcina sp. FSL K6-5500 TaxID=2921558 RepID=UPI0030FBEAA7
MLNSFGKFCRKLRIDKGELLKDMALILGVTSSYLSAVENGKRNVPRNWIEKISEMYSLNSSDIKELERSFDESKKVVQLDFNGYSSEEKNDLLAFAREFKGLNEDDREKIKDILLKSKKRRD